MSHKRWRATAAFRWKRNLSTRVAPSFSAAKSVSIAHDDGPWIVTDQHIHTEGGEHIGLYRIVDPDPFSTEAAEWIFDRTPTGKRLFKLKALADGPPDRAARPRPKAGAPKTQSKRVQAAAAAAHRRTRATAAATAPARTRTKKKKAEVRAEAYEEVADAGDDAAHMLSICVLAVRGGEYMQSCAYVLDDGTCCGVDGQAFGFIDLDSLEVGDAEEDYVGCLAEGLDNRCIVEDDDENDIAWLDLGTATVHEPSGSSIFEIKPNGSVHDGGEDERFQLVKYTHHHMKLAAAFLMLLAPKFRWS